jgi:hypothetical protein
LNDSIETALAQLPESERPSAVEKLHVWTEQLRAAIIDFENVELTPEKAVAHLRDMNYGNDAIAYFLSRLGDTSKLNPKEVWPTITRAWRDTIARDQQIRGTYLPQYPPTDESLEDELRSWVFRRETGKLTPSQLAEMQQYAIKRNQKLLSVESNRLGYLYGPGQPVPFPHIYIYEADRDLLVKGRLWRDPTFCKAASFASFRVREAGQR